MKSLLLILTLSMMTISASVFSATSADLPLVGSVPLDVSIEFLNKDATTLILNTVITDKRISDVHIMSNSPGGYEVSWHSANAGKMKHTQNPAALISYNLSSVVGGVASAQYSLGTDQFFGDTSNTPSDYNLQLLFSSNPVMDADLSSANSTNHSAAQLLAGIYQDIITATISAL